MITDVAAKDRPGEAVAVVIWTGMVLGKAAASSHDVTIGHMKTGRTRAPHATIVQIITKKIPSLQIFRVVCRLGAPDMGRAMEHIFLK